MNFETLKLLINDFTEKYEHRYSDIDATNLPAVSSDTISRCKAVVTLLTAPQLVPMPNKPMALHSASHSSTIHSTVQYCQGQDHVKMNKFPKPCDKCPEVILGPLIIRYRKRISIIFE